MARAKDNTSRHDTNEGSCERLYQESGLDTLDLFHGHVDGHLTDVIQQHARHIFNLCLGIAGKWQQLWRGMTINHSKCVTKRERDRDRNKARERESHHVQSIFQQPASSMFHTSISYDCTTVISNNGFQPYCNTAICKYVPLLA